MFPIGFYGCGARQQDSTRSVRPRPAAGAVCGWTLGRSVGPSRPKIFAALRAVGVGRSAYAGRDTGARGRTGRSVGDVHYEINFEPPLIRNEDFIGKNLSYVISSKAQKLRLMALIG